MQFTTCCPRGGVAQWYVEGDAVPWLRFEVSFALSSFAIFSLWFLLLCDGEVAIFTSDAPIIS